MLVCEHRSRWKMSGTHATLMEFDSGSLVRDMHTNSELNVYAGSGRAPAVLSHTKEQRLVPLPLTSTTLSAVLV